MKTQKIVLGLAALLMVIAGCDSGSGLRASTTRTNKHGATTKYEVAIAAPEKIEKTEEAPKRADSEKSILELLGELESAVADINAKTTALKAKLIEGGSLLEVDKDGDLKLSERAKRLMAPDEPEAEPEAEAEAEGEESTEGEKEHVDKEKSA